MSRLRLAWAWAKKHAAWILVGLLGSATLILGLLWRRSRNASSLHKLEDKVGEMNRAADAAYETARVDCARDRVRELDDKIAAVDKRLKDPERAARRKDRDAQIDQMDEEELAREYRRLLADTDFRSGE